MQGHAAALVTGPVSKKVIAKSGAPGSSNFAGHTEHIAARTGAKTPIMIFAANEISTALVTTHLALKDVSSQLTPEAVAQATSHLAELLWLLGKRPTRVVVSSLNPHAGEQGMFGDEEHRVIVPGIELARNALRERGISATLTGPVGGETAFRQAFDGLFDGVVAMYHDQATIPMKVRCFGEAVNVTAGLPLIRTSVDHGTAYDIAASTQADASSMVEAIRLAARLVRAKRKMARA
jgi:4-hydroxythreonine-4-phosphate dehydrogenase